MFPRVLDELIWVLGVLEDILFLLPLTENVLFLLPELEDLILQLHNVFFDSGHSPTCLIVLIDILKDRLLFYLALPQVIDVCP